MELVPLKVIIGIKPNGQCDYPDFNSLAIVQSSGMDWSNYIDVYGSGWLYDNKIGHKEVDAESPAGKWLGMILVPSIFAEQAIAAYPTLVSKLTEIESETFYNNRHALDFSDEEIDIQIVQGIQLKKSLGKTLTADQEDAIDPTSDKRGIRKNKYKTFSDYKTLKNITIKKDGG